MNFGFYSYFTFGHASPYLHNIAVYAEQYSHYFVFSMEISDKLATRLLPKYLNESNWEKTQNLIYTVSPCTRNNLHATSLFLWKIPLIALLAY